MKSRLVVAALVASLMFAGQSLAGTVSAVVIDNTSGGAPLAGFVTNDLLLDTAGAGDAIGSMQMLLALSSGSIYQDGFGGDVPPNGMFIGLAPSLEYDTYLAAGTASDAPATTGATPVILGKSDALGGPGGPGHIMNTSAIDATWGPPLGQVNAGSMNYLTARVSLSATANGTVKYRANFSQSPSAIELEGTIVGGVIMFGQVEMFSVDDLFLGGKLPGQIITGGPLPTNDEDDPDSVAWSLVSLIGPDGAEVGASVDPLTGVFTWDSAPTDSRGGYTATIQGVNAGPNAGTDTGLLTFNLVPEPASITLLGLAMVGVLGLIRRR